MDIVDPCANFANPWPPFFVLDLFAPDIEPQAIFPPTWQQDVMALSYGDACHQLIPEPSDKSPDRAEWTFSVVTAPDIRSSLGWLWKLYHGQFRRFAIESHGIPLFPSNRLDATLTLNILDGHGASNIWHRDANPVSGIFYPVSLTEDEGGELQFRSSCGRLAAIQPRAGLFVCFRGDCEHRVAPLRGTARRLAFAMTYFTSDIDQPFANENNRYGPESDFA